MIDIERQQTDDSKVVYLVTVNGYVDRVFYDYYSAEQYAEELFNGDV